MRSSKALRVAGTATVFALALFTAACSSDTASSDDGTETAELSAPEETSTSAEEEAEDVIVEALEDSDGNVDRVFDATQEHVIQAVEQTFAMQNASATWNGTTLLVTMDGSKDDPTSYTVCTGIDSLLTGDENVIVKYSDGEISCDDRP